MLALLILGAITGHRPFVVIQAGAIADQSIRSTWRKITAHGFSDQTRTVSPSQGYRFTRSDRTSCFDVSQDSYITYAERKGIKGILVIWRKGGIEFKKIDRPIESIRFHEHGGLVAIETRANESPTQTMLCQVKPGLPKLDNFRGKVIGANATCAVVAQGNSTTLQSVRSAPRAEPIRLNTERMLLQRAITVGKITGMKTPPGTFSRLTFSPDSHFMFDATLDSNETMKSIPLSYVSGFFTTQGEIWEYRSNGPITDAFFVDSENFVFYDGESFKMGPPGNLKRYSGGLYTFNCRTKNKSNR